MACLRISENTILRQAYINKKLIDRYKCKNKNSEEMVVALIKILD